MPTETAPASILFLCDYQAPYGGNFIASMLRLDAALRLRGVQTAYLFPAGARARDWCANMQHLGLRVLFLPGGGARARLACLLSAIDAQRATILHVHFGYFPMAELAALLRPRLRLILHFHSDFSCGRSPTAAQRLRDFLKRLPERLIGKRLQKITVSETSARTTRDCIPLHNALAETRFVKQPRTREAVRAALGVCERDTLLLAFGWSPFVKGVDVAAEAVRALHANGHTSLVLCIVCGRTYTPERMRSFLSERAACTGDEPFLRFLPPTEDVFSYHAASDLFLSASRSETFSYALLEAICTRRACVCSDIPGVRWAAPFDTVTFFPSGDAAALSNAILQADARRATPGYAARLAEAAARARSAYALDEWVDGLLRIYGVC